MHVSNIAWPTRTFSALSLLLTSLAGAAQAQPTLAASCSNIDPKWQSLVAQIGPAVVGSARGCAEVAPDPDIDVEQRVSNGWLYLYDDGTLAFDANTGESYEYDGSTVTYYASDDSDGVTLTPSQAPTGQSSAPWNPAPAPAPAAPAPGLPSTIAGGQLPSVAELAAAGTHLISYAGPIPTGTYECRMGFNQFGGRLYILDRSRYTDDSVQRPSIGQYAWDPGTRQMTIVSGDYSGTRGEVAVKGDGVRSGTTDGPPAAIWFSDVNDPGSAFTGTNTTLKMCYWTSGDFYGMPQVS